MHNKFLLVIFSVAAHENQTGPWWRRGLTRLPLDLPQKISGMKPGMKLNPSFVIPNGPPARRNLLGMVWRGPPPACLRSGRHYRIG
jgi:hypothetical protein